ncbi:MAG: ATP synthase F1 subunit delta [Eubacterium sp.]|nr:ATP synthase F1 subunit delta [Eubacterium sp.]
MKKMPEKYAEAFYDLGIRYEDFKEISDVITGDKALREIMGMPVISAEKKENIIQKVAQKAGADKTLTNALMYLCEKRDIQGIEEISEALKRYSLKKESIISATLYCVTEPDKKQEEGIKEYLKKEFGKKDAILNIVKKPELLGGFIIEAEGNRIDRSVLSQLNAINENIKTRS